MSIVPVHGPTMWGYTTLAETDTFVVHVLNEYELEFKARNRSDLGADDPYTWDFGDGTQVTNGQVVRHEFAPGTYVVTLSIETTGDTVTDQVEITIGPDGLRSTEDEQQEETPEAA